MIGNYLISDDFFFYFIWDELTISSYEFLSVFVETSPLALLFPLDLKINSLENANKIIEKKNPAIKIDTISSLFFLLISNSSY